ncbi:MAG: ABC transporter ATP-binding protein [Cupriavidus sp.]|nr:ABC transporter ATP-binding protein [Cupriavidus sp.]NUT13678.1 ABC transporter ATP-binding protein [Cupriavidus sp.]
MSAGPHWSVPLASCPRLTLRDVRLRTSQRVLVERLSLAIGPGELWCIAGPNGAGKSTLMTVLAGLRHADGGSVEIDGTAPALVDPAQLARQRAYLPQAVHDSFAMPVLDAVRVGRHPHLSGWGWSGREDDRIVHDVIRAMDIEALAARDVLTLSGGERQRVSLAAALAQQAPLLLLDEPVSHLDLRHQILVLEQLADLARAGRHAIVVILHDLTLALRYATHALLMAEDGTALHGPAAQVLTPEHCSRALRTAIVSVSDGAHTALIPDGARPTTLNSHHD